MHQDTDFYDFFLAAGACTGCRLQSSQMLWQHARKRAANSSKRKPVL